MIKRILLLLAVLWLSPVHAQSLTKLCFPTGTQGGSRTTCQEVTTANPLPITGVNVSIGSLSISALNAVSVTVTNTTAVPVFVSTPNGFGSGGGSGGSVTQGTNPWIISTPNVVVTNESSNSQLSVATGTTADSAYAGSGSASLIAIGKGIYAAAVNGTGTTGSAPPASAILNGGVASGATGGLLAAPKICDSSAIYDASTSGSTKIITGVASRKVYICGFMFATGLTATNVKLVEGTVTNCGTGTANMTPAFQLTANDKIGANAATWNGLSTATAADDVCINASAGNAVQAIVYYTIQ